MASPSQTTIVSGKEDRSMELDFPGEQSNPVVEVPEQQQLSTVPVQSINEFQHLHFVPLSSLNSLDHSLLSLQSVSSIENQSFSLHNLDLSSTSHSSSSFASKQLTGLQSSITSPLTSKSSFAEQTSSSQASAQSLFLASLSSRSSFLWPQSSCKTSLISRFGELPPSTPSVSQISEIEQQSSIPYLQPLMESFSRGSSSLSSFPSHFQESTSEYSTGPGILQPVEKYATKLNILLSETQKSAQQTSSLTPKPSPSVAFARGNSEKKSSSVLTIRPSLTPQLVPSEPSAAKKATFSQVSAWTVTEKESHQEDSQQSFIVQSQSSKTSTWSATEQVLSPPASCVFTYPPKICSATSLYQTLPQPLPNKDFTQPDATQQSVIPFLVGKSLEFSACNMESKEQNSIVQKTSIRPSCLPRPSSRLSMSPPPLRTGSSMSLLRPSSLPDTQSLGQVSPLPASITQSPCSLSSLTTKFPRTRSGSISPMSSRLPYHDRQLQRKNLQQSTWSRSPTAISSRDSSPSPSSPISRLTSKLPLPLRQASEHSLTEISSLKSNQSTPRLQSTKFNTSPRLCRKLPITRSNSHQSIRSHSPLLAAVDRPSGQKPSSIKVSTKSENRPLAVLVDNNDSRRELQSPQLQSKQKTLIASQLHTKLKESSKKKALTSVSFPSNLSPSCPNASECCLMPYNSTKSPAQSDAKLLPKEPMSSSQSTEKSVKISPATLLSAGRSSPCRLKPPGTFTKNYGTTRRKTKTLSPSQDFAHETPRQPVLHSASQPTQSPKINSSFSQQRTESGSPVSQRPSGLTSRSHTPLENKDGRSSSSPISSPRRPSRLPRPMLPRICNAKSGQSPSNQNKLRGHPQQNKVIQVIEADRRADEKISQEHQPKSDCSTGSMYGDCARTDIQGEKSQHRTKESLMQSDGDLKFNIKRNEQIQTTQLSFEECEKVSEFCMSSKQVSLSMPTSKSSPKTSVDDIQRILAGRSSEVLHWLMSENEMTDNEKEKDKQNTVNIDKDFGDQLAITEEAKSLEKHCRTAEESKSGKVAVLTRVKKHKISTTCYPLRLEVSTGHQLTDDYSDAFKDFDTPNAAADCPNVDNGIDFYDIPELKSGRRVISDVIEDATGEELAHDSSDGDSECCLLFGDCSYKTGPIVDVDEQSSFHITPNMSLSDIKGQTMNLHRTWSLTSSESSFSHHTKMQLNSKLPSELPGLHNGPSILKPLKPGDRKSIESRKELIHSKPPTARGTSTKGSLTTRSCDATPTRRPSAIPIPRRPPRSFARPTTSSLAKAVLTKPVRDRKSACNRISHLSAYPPNNATLCKEKLTTFSSSFSLAMPHKLKPRILCPPSEHEQIRPQFPCSLTKCTTHSADMTRRDSMNLSNWAAVSLAVSKEHPIATPKMKISALVVDPLKINDVVSALAQPSASDTVTENGLSSNKKNSSNQLQQLTSTTHDLKLQGSKQKSDDVIGSSLPSGAEGTLLENDKTVLSLPLAHYIPDSKPATNQPMTVSLPSAPPSITQLDKKCLTEECQRASNIDPGHFPVSHSPEISGMVKSKHKTFTSNQIGQENFNDACVGRKNAVISVSETVLNANSMSITRLIRSSPEVLPLSTTKAMVPHSEQIEKKVCTKSSTATKKAQIEQQRKLTKSIPIITSLSPSGAYCSTSHSEQWDVDLGTSVTNIKHNDTDCSNVKLHKAPSPRSPIRMFVDLESDEPNLGFVPCISINRLDQNSPEPDPAELKGIKSTNISSGDQLSKAQQPRPSRPPSAHSRLTLTPSYASHLKYIIDTTGEDVIETKLSKELNMSQVLLAPEIRKEAQKNQNNVPRQNNNLVTLQRIIAHGDGRSVQNTGRVSPAAIQAVSQSCNYLSSANTCSLRTNQDTCKIEPTVFKGNEMAICKESAGDVTQKRKVPLDVVEVTSSDKISNQHHPEMLHRQRMDEIRHRQNMNKSVHSSGILQKVDASSASVAQTPKSTSAEVLKDSKICDENTISMTTSASVQNSTELTEKRNKTHACYVDRVPSITPFKLSPVKSNPKATSGKKLLPAKSIQKLQSLHSKFILIGSQGAFRESIPAGSELAQKKQKATGYKIMPGQSIYESYGAVDCSASAVIQSVIAGMHTPSNMTYVIANKANQGRTASNMTYSITDDFNEEVKRKKARLNKQLGDTEPVTVQKQLLKTEPDRSAILSGMNFDLHESVPLNHQLQPIYSPEKTSMITNPLSECNSVMNAINPVSYSEIYKISSTGQFLPVSGRTASSETYDVLDSRKDLKTKKSKRIKENDESNKLISQVRCETGHPQFYNEIEFCGHEQNGSKVTRKSSFNPRTMVTKFNGNDHKDAVIPDEVALKNLIHSKASNDVTDLTNAKRLLVGISGKSDQYICISQIMCHDSNVEQHPGSLGQDLQKAFSLDDVQMTNKGKLTKESRKSQRINSAIIENEVGNAEACKAASIIQLALSKPASIVALKTKSKNVQEAVQSNCRIEANQLPTSKQTTSGELSAVMSGVNSIVVNQKKSKKKEKKNCQVKKVASEHFMLDASIPTSYCDALRTVVDKSTKNISEVKLLKNVVPVKEHNQSLKLVAKTPKKGTVKKHSHEKEDKKDPEAIAARSIAAQKPTKAIKMSMPKSNTKSSGINTSNVKLSLITTGTQTTGYSEPQHSQTPSNKTVRSIGVSVVQIWTRNHPFTPAASPGGDNMPNIPFPVWNKEVIARDIVFDKQTVLHQHQLPDSDAWNRNETLPLSHKSGSGVQSELRSSF